MGAQSLYLGMQASLLLCCSYPNVSSIVFECWLCALTDVAYTPTDDLDSQDEDEGCSDGENAEQEDGRRADFSDNGKLHHFILVR